MAATVVLVVADEYYASLAAVRALRAAGYEPWVGAITPDGFAHRSRATAGVVPLVSPNADGDAFVEAVAHAASRIGAAVVLPGSEAAVSALSDRADAFPSRTVVGTQSSEVLRKATDKAQLADLAAAAGLDTPPTHVFEGSQFDRSLGTVTYPAIVKPARTAPAAPGRVLEQLDPEPVGTEAELLRSIRRRPEGKWLVQPLLRGRLLAVAGIAREGEVIASVHQAARRIYPPAAGVSAYAETIPREAGLESRVRELLRLVGLTGIWELQFIAHQGRPYVVDLNPRPYGSLGLAVAAGVNLPAMWVDVLLDREPLVTDYRVGVRFRAEMRELGVLANALRRGDLRTAAGVVVPRPHTTHAVLSLRDPGPSLRLITRALARLRPHRRSY